MLCSRFTSQDSKRWANSFPSKDSSVRQLFYFPGLKCSAVVSPSQGSKVGKLISLTKTSGVGQLIWLPNTLANHCLGVDLPFQDFKWWTVDLPSQDSSDGQLICLHNTPASQY